MQFNWHSSLPSCCDVMPSHQLPQENDSEYVHGCYTCNFSVSAGVKHKSNPLHLNQSIIYSCNEGWETSQTVTEKSILADVAVTNDLWPFWIISSRDVIHFSISKLSCQAKWQTKGHTNLGELASIQLIRTTAPPWNTEVKKDILHICMYNVWVQYNTLLCKYHFGVLNTK